MLEYYKSKGLTHLLMNQPPFGSFFGKKAAQKTSNWQSVIAFVEYSVIVPQDIPQGTFPRSISHLPPVFPQSGNATAHTDIP